ncbi:pimeloyl-ACP methyl ester carboxylesterase [Oxalobacteraceae bacterium GrIS 1.11]
MLNATKTLLVFGALNLGGCAALLEPAGAALQHGTLTVGALRTPPGTLTLPYLHYRQPGPARPTVFLLGGGPGLGNVKNRPPAEWLRDFDVVVLEYRGVGLSSLVLDTPHFARGLLQYGVGSEQAQAQALERAYRAGFADLARQGIAFDEFSVDALADDIERLRRQLKLEQIYLVAHSFGTRVALSYQSRYRERAAGSILFSMNTPGGFIWYPAQTQQVWTRYQGALARSKPQLAASLGPLLQGAARRPEKYGVLPVNNAKAMMVAFFMSFNRASRDSVLEALAASRRGASASWYLYSLGYNWFIRFGFNWADFYLKAYTSDCDPAAIERLAAQGRDALFGSPSAPLFAGADAFAAAGGHCRTSGWTPDYRNTLAITGEFDPSTPIERKPVDFPEQNYIVIQDAGHADVFYSNGADTAGWLRRFFFHPDQARPPGAAALPQVQARN